MGERAARWWGIASLAAAGVLTGTSEGGRRQAGLAVSGIAVPVALVVVVAGVSLGTVSPATVGGGSVDYWIVPESAAGYATAVDVGGPKLGEVHAVGDRLAARDDVEYATPVALAVVPLRSGATTEYVLAVGVIPGAAPREFAGVSTAGLSPGDPHYANGSYDGPWTGEARLSSAAAELLDVHPGDSIGVEDSNRSFVAVAGDDGGGGDADAIGGLPVVLVHLGEHQAIAGGVDGDLADQLLVSADDPSVRPVLESVYPHTTVLARDELTPGQVLDEELPLAMAVSALAVALVAGVLSAASTMGMAVAAAARRRAVMAAMGISDRSRAAIVAFEALVIAGAGGAIGVVLGAVGIVVANAAAVRTLGIDAVAAFHPAFAAYGVAVALAIGLATVPYLLLVGRRHTTIAALRR